MCTHIKRIIKKEKQQQQQYSFCKPKWKRTTKEKQRERKKSKYIKCALIRMWTKVLNVNWSMPFALDKLVVCMLNVNFLFYTYNIVCIFLLICVSSGRRRAIASHRLPLFPLEIHFYHSINAKRPNRRRLWINSIKYLDFGDSVAVAVVMLLLICFATMRLCHCVTLWELFVPIRNGNFLESLFEIPSL